MNTEKQTTKTDKPMAYDTLLPSVYPSDLNECLKIFEKIRYKSYGFGMLFLDYNYTFGYWSVGFRNPANFENPEIKAETPEKAVHEMLDFLKSRRNRG